MDVALIKNQRYTAMMLERSAFACAIGNPKSQDALFIVYLETLSVVHYAASESNYTFQIPQHKEIFLLYLYSLQPGIWP
jgi:hypothetical protein